MLILLAPPWAGGETHGAVDLELVLAVDVSSSMDADEKALQRAGYVAAFRSPEVIRAIVRGRHGRIMVTYLEWSGTAAQKVVVPWTLIDGPHTANAFADTLASQQPGEYNRTSISSAMIASRGLFGTSGALPARQVLDVSGDGPNNQGRRVDQVRDRLIADGIVINGLPLMVKETAIGFGIDKLDQYYADCVIGGPGAFMISVQDWAEFPHAVRRKLVLEIAGTRTLPVMNASYSAASDLPVVLAQAARTTECDIGERIIQPFLPDYDYKRR